MYCNMLTIDFGVIDDLGSIFTVREIIMIDLQPILILGVTILQITGSHNTPL